jgi:hypothetical protein
MPCPHPLSGEDTTLRLLAFMPMEAWFLGCMKVGALQPPSLRSLACDVEGKSSSAAAQTLRLQAAIARATR